MTKITLFGDPSSRTDPDDSCQEESRNYSDHLKIGFLCSLYVGDLNRKLVQYSNHGDLFNRQMVPYSDALYHDSLVFISTFGYQTTTGIPVRYTDAW